jgi:hypothetical protein
MPPAFAWLDEVFCFQTDGSQRVSRHAYLWNTNGNRYFNNYGSIGSYSQDGKFWGFNSDWWCTLGNTSGGASNLCGHQFWMNHQYALHDMMSDPSGMAGSYLGRIFEVTTAGTTNNNVPYWTMFLNNTLDCNNTTIIDPNNSNATIQGSCGTVVFTYKGAENAQSSVFLVRLK